MGWVVMGGLTVDAPGNPKAWASCRAHDLPFPIPSPVIYNFQSQIQWSTNAKHLQPLIPSWHNGNAWEAGICKNWHNQIRQWPNIAHNLVSSLLATLFESISTCTKDMNIAKIFIQNQCTHCMYIVLITGSWQHLWYHNLQKQQSTTNPDQF